MHFYHSHRIRAFLHSSHDPLRSASRGAWSLKTRHDSRHVCLQTLHGWMNWKLSRHDRTYEPCTEPDVIYSWDYSAGTQRIVDHGCVRTIWWIIRAARSYVTLSAEVFNRCVTHLEYTFPFCRKTVSWRPSFPTGTHARLLGLFVRFFSSSKKRENVFFFKDEKLFLVK